MRAGGLPAPPLRGRAAAHAAERSPCKTTRSRLPSASATSRNISRRLWRRRARSAFSRSMPRIIWARAGARTRELAALRRDHALSIHGVGLSIGGSAPLDRDHLARLKALCDRYQPESFSEHLAWATHDGIFYNDLLPLPLNEATLARVIGHVDEVQNALGRRILIENPAAYLSFDDSTIVGAGLPRRARAAQRLRPAARHQQCLRQRLQQRLRRQGLSRRFPAR